jgi:DUF2971 family protein
MWSHYTDAHRGFVIGFDSKNLFFGRRNLITALTKVTYSSERSVLPPFEEFSDSHQALAAMFFFSKSEHWAYEEEFRIIAHPSRANVRVPVENGFDIYLFAFPPNALKEIVLGHLMPEGMKDRIVALVAEHYPHVELSESRLNEEKFDLDIVRIN